MIKKMIITLAILGIICLLVADKLEDNLKNFTEVNAKGYLKPFVNSFGAGLNSGHFTSAKTNKQFMPSLAIGSTMVLVPSSDKKFYLNGTNVETATIFGKNGAPGYPPGANISMLPVPQAAVSLGLPAGNEIMLLWLPETQIDKNIGSFSLYGVGVKHSIDQYLGKFFPVHLAVQGVYQNVEVGKVMKIDAWNFNLLASKNLLFFGVYGGIGYEYTNFDIKYKMTDGTKQDFSMVAENDIKMTIGAEYNILILGIFADYTIANVNSINAGLKVGF